MAKTSEETKDKIRAAFESGKFSVKSIAERYGVSLQTVYNITKGSTRNERDESSEEEIEETEVSENDSEEETDWESWADFWKEKYLELHAKMVELGHL
jgi:transposase-like protein